MVPVLMFASKWDHYVHSYFLILIKRKDPNCPEVQVVVKLSSVSLSTQCSSLNDQSLQMANEFTLHLEGRPVQTLWKNSTFLNAS